MKQFVAGAASALVVVAACLAVPAWCQEEPQPVCVPMPQPDPPSALYNPPEPFTLDSRIFT